MRKWWVLVLVTLCWIAAGFAIFGSGQTPAENVMSKRAERIVTLAPNLTEMVFALGLGERIAAVTSDSDYPAAAKDKPSVGTFWQPSLEAVIAARPDLVVTLGFTQQTALARRLTRIGYRTVTVNIEKVNDFFAAAEQIGVATGSGAEAKALTTKIKKRLQNLSSMTGKSGKVKVLYVVQRSPLRVAGRDTFVNEMLELAGGENAIGPTIHKYPPIGAEQVWVCGAEVIIEVAMGQSDTSKQKESAIEYWSRFKSVPAVANERIYVVEADTVSRLGPRLYEGVETIARCLRPEVFEKADL